VSLEEGSSGTFTVAVDFGDTTDGFGSLLWDFGDGATSTAVAPAHTYVDDGTYVVTLTLVDTDGSSATATRLATVSNANPSIDNITAPVTGNQGETLTFSVTVSGTLFLAVVVAVVAVVW